MRPYTKNELDALQVLAELHADTDHSAFEAVALIKMVRERDEVISRLQAQLDEYESRIREAVREYAATVRPT